MENATGGAEDRTFAELDLASRYRALSEASFEAIFLSDKGLCLDANASASRLFGYTREEFIGRMGTDMIAPEDRDVVMQNMLAGHEDAYEVTALRKDGTMFPCEIQGRMFDFEGRRLRVTALRDITVRVRAREEALQARKLQAVGTLTGGIAHDFNNLMTIVLGQAELLLERGVAGASRESVEAIRQAGRRAARMVDKLLAFSRRQPQSTLRLDANAVIADFRVMLRRLIREDIELVCDLGHGLGPIQADPGQLEQVLVNLVTNASDAVDMLDDPGRPRRITIRTREAGPGGLPPGADGPRGQGHLVLAVLDTGVGVAADVRDRIFEPFFTTKEERRGTGLGLATVYGIAQQNGATVTVRDNPGGGAVFELLWPLVGGLAERPVPGVEPPADLRGTETIVLVEDDPDLLRYACQSCEMLGYTVHAFPNGQVALERIRDDGLQFDGLATDLVMPGLSGHGLINAVRALRPDAVFVLISGYTFDQPIGTGGLGPDVSFLAKPYLARNLVGCLREKWGRAEPGSGAGSGGSSRPSGARW